MPQGRSQFVKPRLPSLDGLRAVSIALVLLQHASLTPSFPFALAPLGDAGFGVHIFFVISGFIITLLLLDEERENDGISLKRFYLRRMVRILPVFWTFLLIMLLARRIYVGEFFQAATFTAGMGLWSTPGTWNTAHGWSLAVEEQFYLLWPAAMVLLGRTSWRVALLIAVVALANFTRCWAMTHSAVYWSMSHPGHWWSPFERAWQLMGVRTFLSHVDLLACGCLLAIAMQRRPSLVQTIANWRPAIGRPRAVIVMYL
ncbi:MAG TPA: acyltransferase, partial [Tepidisphaeraceae bacterium]|nr:acyltransferase [Tepidisphaeraceae bacterium]